MLVFAFLLTASLCLCVSVVILLYWIGFAALRAVEYDPDDYVIAEILEAVDLACGSEQQVAGAERLAALSDDEIPAALYNDVHFIARVRLLRVRAARRVDLHEQTAMLEDGREPLSLRPRQAGQGFGQRGFAPICKRLALRLYVFAHGSGGSTLWLL